MLFETGLIKKAKEWDEGQGKKYKFPKELSSKMYSQKKPVDLLGIGHPLIDALLEYYKKEDVAGDILNVEDPILSGNCCARCILRLEFDDNTSKEIYEDLPLSGNSQVDDISLLKENKWNENSQGCSIENVRAEVEMLMRSREAFHKSEYEGVINIRSRCVGLLDFH